MHTDTCSNAQNEMSGATNANHAGYPGSFAKSAFIHEICIKPFACFTGHMNGTAGTASADRTAVIVGRVEGAVSNPQRGGPAT